jgi:hypothetical protein
MKPKKSTPKPKFIGPVILENPLAPQRVPSEQAVPAPPSSRVISEPAMKAFSTWMKQTFGTEDRELQSQLLCQATSIVPDFVGREMKTMDHVAAALHGIGPRDALEGLLAVQMVGIHTLAMECMARAALREQTDLGVEVNINRATKLMRTFANQTEALGRYRGKGEQKMTVEHVHVYKGGQAIVGQVSQKNIRQIRGGNNGGGDDEHE